MIGSSLLLDSEGAAEGYKISRSLRLRASANAYLQRTNATTGTNPLKFVVSGWVKRGSTTELPLLGSSTGTAAFDFFGFWTGDILAFRIRNSSTVDLVRLESSAVFRDYSAWYHIVAEYDSANATQTERLKLYVNGVQLTAFGTATYPSLNQAPTGDFLTDMQIGRTNTNSSNQNYGDGHIAEVYFIDGQSLPIGLTNWAEAFGETNPLTGVWRPKAYNGTYGTNGFYLSFSDNSSVAAIGGDYSGNSNNWTPNNINVSAYTGTPPNNTSYDSMLDVPTMWDDGGNGRGNYATWNPLNLTQSSLSQSNLLSTATGSSTNVVSTFPTATTGKWYAEITLNFTANINWPINIGASDGIGGNTYCRLYTDWSAKAIFKSVNGTTSSVTPSGAFPANGDILKIAYDADTGKLWLGLNGNWYGASGSLTGNPATGADATLSGIAGKQIYPNHSNAGGPAQNAYLNCGQRPFSYTPPSGFKAMNTQNLPESTILRGSQYFNATTYLGNGTGQSIANIGAMQPDLVWIKGRSVAASHNLLDSVRGARIHLSSNLADAEQTESVGFGLTAFNNDGFSLGIDNVGSGQVNSNGNTFIGWQWKEGSIQGFDIVAYTGDGTTNRAVSHSLGVTPSMIIIKARSTGATNWVVHHKSMGDNGGSPAYLYYCFLDSSALRAASTSLLPKANLSSTTFPTSGATNNTNVNNNGTTYIAYLFSEVDGFSKFGSYIGNGSTNGPFVYLGFRPRFVMIKKIYGGATADSWEVFDTSRNANNVNNFGLSPNAASSEVASRFGDVTANGFKLRFANGTTNESGYTYMYAAFAENPFKNALAR